MLKPKRSRLDRRGLQLVWVCVCAFGCEVDPRPTPPVVGRGGLGVECDAASDCESGHCVDGVCCDSACTGVCAACDVAGREGDCAAPASDPSCPAPACAGVSTECRPLDGGALEPSCASIGVCRTHAECAAELASAGTSCQGDAGECDGAGACLVPDRSPLGGACEEDDQCAEGHCASTLGAAVCCDSACDGVCEVCSSAGRCGPAPATQAGCAEPLTALGGACDANADCESGLCAPNGICCDDACDGVCERCSAGGQCQATGFSFCGP